MNSRKLPAEAQAIFDKYTVNFRRRLPKETALEMLQKDFGLSPGMSDFMFCSFVADNAQVLTPNEFNNFYVCFGKDANEYLNKYKELEAAGGGTADIGGLFDFLKALKTLTGRTPTDEELEQYIKAAAGEKRTVGQNEFVALIKRVKMTRS